MIALVALAATAAAAPRCDPERIALVRDLVTTFDATYRTDVALAGFAEACPGPVAEAASDWLGTPEGLRPAIEARAVLDATAGWLAVCPAGPGVLATALTLASGDARDHVFRACGLASKGWIDAAEWRSAPGPGLLGLLAAAHLEAAGVAPDTTRLLVRAMVGVLVVPPASDTAPSPYRAEIPWDLILLDDELQAILEGNGDAGGLLRSRDTGDVEIHTAPESVRGTVLPSDRLAPVPGTASCPPPDPAARGPRCEVRVEVDAEGTIVRTAWDACPQALRPGMRNLLTQCRFAPGGGSPVPVTWTAP